MQEYNTGLIGASTSVYAERLGGFGRAVKNYQDALMEYRSVLKATPAAKALAKLGFLVMATPIGWVGLVVGGVVIAGAAATASITLNNAVKNNSGSWYDAIMKSLGIR